MTHGFACWADSRFALNQDLTDGTLLVALRGALDFTHVDALAACADQACGPPVRAVRMDLGGLTAADEVGARTLAAACQCLRQHGRRLEVRGLRPEIGAVLDRLGLTLTAPAGTARACQNLTAG